MFTLSCCTFNFPGLTFLEGLALVKNMGFDTVDVGAKGLKGELSQSLAVKDPYGYASWVSGQASVHGMRLDEFFVCTLVIDGQDAPITTANQELRSRMRDHFDRLCCFAKAAGFNSLMIVPDKAQDNMSELDAWNLSIDMLTSFVKIAASHSIGFNIEPIVFSILKSPQQALQMAAEVPGLRFTVDYSHFIYAGFEQSDIEPLHQYLSHIHARQAKKGVIQCGLDEGVISFRRVAELLLSSGYTGRVAVEFIDTIQKYVLVNGVVRQNSEMAARIKYCAEHEL